VPAVRFGALQRRSQARTVLALRYRRRRHWQGTGARVLRHSRDLLVVRLRRGWKALDRASLASAPSRSARSASLGRLHEEVFFSFRVGSLQSLARRFAPSRAALGGSASRLRRLALLRSSRLGSYRTPGALGWQRLRRFRIKVLAPSATGFAARKAPKARPNPSVNARPSGVPPSPAPGFVYPPSAGLGATPPGPRYLER